MSKKINFGSGIQRMLENAEKQVEQSNSSSLAEKEVEVTINFKIPKSLHTALKIYTAQEGISIKELATKLFSETVQK